MKEVQELRVEGYDYRTGAKTNTCMKTQKNKFIWEQKWMS